MPARALCTSGVTSRNITVGSFVVQRNIFKHAVFLFCFFSCGRQSFRLGRGAAAPERPVLDAAMHQSVLVTIVRHRLRMCQKLLPRPHYHQPVFYLNAQIIRYRAGHCANVCGDRSLLLICKKSKTGWTQKNHTFIRAGPAVVLELPAPSSFSSTSPRH